MSLPIKAIDDLFERADVGLSNAKKDPFIVERITPLGFTEIRLDLGLALLKKTRKSVQYQMRKSADQQETTARFLAKRYEAELIYGTYVKMIRKTFNTDVQIMKMLGIPGNRLRSFEGFILQTTQFYQNAINNEDVFAKIEPLVGSKENLKNNWKLVTDCINLNKEQEKKKGDAQDATDQRDKDLKELRIFMYNFTIACRSRLKDRPQLLEKLKIKAYSRGYKKKKKGTTTTTNTTDTTLPAGEAGDQ